MPRQSASKQIEAIRRQQVELARKLKEAEARSRTVSAEDTRRARELAGAALLTSIATDPKTDFAKAARELLGYAIKRPKDRALFPFLAGVSPPPAAAEPAAETEAKTEETAE